MSEYNTKSVGAGVAKVKDVIVQQEPMARLIFRPLIHSGGVKGRLIRQRRVSKDDNWLEDTPIDIRSLEKGQSFNVEINTEGVKKLESTIEELRSLVEQNGIEYGNNRYRTVANSSVVVDSKNIADFAKQVIDKGFSRDVLNAFLNSDNIDSDSFVIAADRKKKQKVIEELKQRLNDGKFAEVSGDDSWQKFILNNNWMFGANYLEPIDRTKINLEGSMPDFIYPTADGYVDILEIKLPDDRVLLEDSGHSGAWRWSLESNKSIGQVINYIDDMTRLRLEIEKKISDSYGLSVNVIKPRAYILIGDSNAWQVTKKNALRKLNSVLHGIEIITYNDLLNRAKRMVA